MPSKPKPDQFTLGYLAAAAYLARRGEDSFAEELMGDCGITSTRGLHGKGLEQFDKKPLYRVMKAAMDSDAK